VPFPTPYDLHAQSLCGDQYRDVYDHNSCYSHDICSYCESFDHDVNSCPDYDISNEAYASLNAMIETMNERHEHFVSEMRECGLLHETGPSLPFPRLESSLYDNCESTLPLESLVIDDTRSIELEEVFEPPLTTLPLITPFFSSTPIATPP